MPIQLRPLDVDPTLRAQGALGQANFQWSERRRASQARTRALVGALGGAGLGLAAAPALGVGALQAAGGGAQIGSSLLSGNPLGAGMSALQLGGLSQQAEAGKAVQGALGGFRQTPALEASPDAGIVGGEGVAAQLTPTQMRYNAYLGALQGIAKTNPGAAVQGLGGLLSQDAAAEAAAADRALRVRGQDITVRGQDKSAEEKAADRAALDKRAEADRKAADARNAAKIDAQKYIANQKLLQDGETTDRMRARLLKQQIDALNGVKGARPLNSVEKQALLKLERADPFAARASERMTPDFTPGAAPASGGAGAPTTQAQDAAAAQAAIAAGAPEEEVRRRFREQWGVDLQ